MTLAEQVKALRTPRDYYAGLSPLMAGLPRNILLFHREKPFGVGTNARHHRYVLVNCIQGRAAIIVDGRFHYLTPGSSFLVFPFQEHSYAQFREEPVVWLFTTFEYDRDACFESLRDLVCTLDAGELVRLGELVDWFQAAQRGHAGALDELALVLAGLLSRLVRRRGQFGVDPDELLSPHYEVVRKSVRYIRAHIEERLHLADIASAVGLSESRLRAVFRAMVGVSLGAFVAGLRMGRACTLLRETSLNVTEVAGRCGFGSVYSFSRAFKRSQGISPRAYRSEQSAPRPRRAV